MIPCGHVAETGQVCDLERGHDGQHGCKVVVELAAWGDDGIVTRSYLTSEDAEPEARTE